MQHKWRSIVLAGYSLLLVACAGNQQVRGMTQQNWQALTPEQKQFIIDTGFQKDVEQTAPSHTLLEEGKIPCASHS
jgi:hypothetical protein